MNAWTNNEIERILLQLDGIGVPFDKYTFRLKDGRPLLIGKGAYANVYSASKRDDANTYYAIKVIGFGDKRVDSEAFQESVYAQTRLAGTEKTVVRIYDSVEVLVWIEGESTVTRIQKLFGNMPVSIAGNCLHLQFVVMEYLDSLLRKSPGGKIDFDGVNLAKGFDEEIAEFGYDIGRAIKAAHKAKLIHRDVKLENIFYSPKERCYKLGDFGISKTTEDGMLSTIAYTNGYGAPEVIGAFENKYDLTADIYSFGMMLYVLLNNMRFPSSNGYYPCKEQYMSGYCAPRPANGSDELCRIVLKMISFNPDDRYQKVEDVLVDLERIILGERGKFLKDRLKTSLAMGIFFAVSGVIIPRIPGLEEYKWTSILLISLAFVLLFYSLLLDNPNDNTSRRFLGKNLFWIVFAALYLYWTYRGTHGYTMSHEFWAKNGFRFREDFDKLDPLFYIGKIFGEGRINELLYTEPEYVGYLGALFCVLWMLRENVMLLTIYLKKR